MRYFALTCLILSSTTLSSQDLKISLKNGDSLEVQAKVQLERIINKHEDALAPWLFTREVAIDKSAIPFSHPVLTLNCNYLKHYSKQLANFLHEQFHWLVATMPAEEKAAIEDFRKIFLEVPVGGSKGARDEHSTYLHLIVCDLELQSMSKIVGEPTARQILAEWKHYTWIYDKVLRDKRIREINSKHGFLID